MKYIFVKAFASNDPNDKAKWIEYQINEFGYNDIYFADDSQNIDAVRKMLEGKKVKFVVQKLIIDSGRNSNNSLSTCITLF